MLILYFKSDLHQKVHLHLKSPGSGLKNWIYYGQTALSCNGKKKKKNQIWVVFACRVNVAKDSMQLEKTFIQTLEMNEQDFSKTKQYSKWMLFFVTDLERHEIKFKSELQNMLLVLKTVICNNFFYISKYLFLFIQYKHTLCSQKNIFLHLIVL